ncbi:GNAT family N-acetyltransferase [Flavobacterium sp.]|uniref:GNAT family N-acetyltransferase n=1 Tax=Flavobacterium sp. TaxID=239 RepID=UPI00333E89B1
MKINLKHQIKNDKYTDYIYEAFDIQNKNESNVIIEANLEHLPKEWNIGVVYGGSGTGKTTILKNYFKKEMDKSHFDNSKSLISNFDWLEPKEATFLLSSMGLSSVPTWLRPFNTLSNGEQYRANLAYIVGSAKENEVILIDEYTSVVDRDVAKAMSNALQKYIRKTNKKIVLASCHFDIMEWLQPDWIYSPSKGRLEIASQLRQPEIKLQIVRCRYETWKLFKQHHYLTEDLNKAATNYLVLWNDAPICFIGVLPFPGVGDEKTRRISRIVVLPDFQGLGLGKNILNYISSLYAKEKSTMYIRTMSPALGLALAKDKNWIATSSNLKIPQADSSGRKLIERPSYSYKYIGQESNDDTSIIKFKTEVYRDVAQNQISIFDILNS